MAVPVNKKKLDKNIEDNILLNNGTQFITAQKLQDTLYPIVNSTFGMKTIWAGIIRSFDNLDGGNDHSFKVVEDYYDPNYFPSNNPTNLTSGVAAYQAAGCRYKLTGVGSGIIQDTYYNQSTEIYTAGTTQSSLLTNGATVWRPASGLTFDVLVGPGGTVTGIQVNNPGSGYSWCGNNQSSTVAPINQTVRILISSATPVLVDIDLSRVCSGAYLYSYDGPVVNLPYNGVATNVYVHNFFIRDADKLNLNAPNIHVSVSGNGLSQPGGSGANYADTTDELYFQHDSTLGNQYKTYLVTAGGVDRTVLGYYALVPFASRSTAGTLASFNRYVEIKVPITNSITY